MNRRNSEASVEGFERISKEVLWGKQGRRDSEWEKQEW